MKHSIFLRIRIKFKDWKNLNLETDITEYGTTVTNKWYIYIVVLTSKYIFASPSISLIRDEAFKTVPVPSEPNITTIFSSYVYVNIFSGNLDWFKEKNLSFFYFPGNGGSWRIDQRSPIGQFLGGDPGNGGRRRHRRNIRSRSGRRRSARRFRPSDGGLNNQPSVNELSVMRSAVVKILFNFFRIASWCCV